MTNSGGTRRFYIPVHSVNVDGTTNSITIENIFYNIIDEEAFVNAGNTLPSGEWTQFENTEYYWIKDDTTKSYILRTGGEFSVLNSDKMIFSIAIYNESDELIETIVLNGLSV